MKTHAQVIAAHEERFGPRLTMEDLEALEYGARCMVTWTGGNGPCEYTRGPWGFHSTWGCAGSLTDVAAATRVRLPGSA
jgi:hypothetical protein